jgi:hypothetical protein
MLTSPAAVLHPGEPFLLDISIQNIADAELRMPWSVDWRIVYGETQEVPEKLVHVLVGIDEWVISDQKIPPGSEGEWKNATSFSLYGVPSKPETIQTIRPGESVRLRTSLTAPSTEKVFWRIRGSLSFFSGLDTTRHLGRSLSHPVDLTPKTQTEPPAKP